MSKWTWDDTIMCIALAALAWIGWVAFHAAPDAPPMPPAAIALDTVPCGHLARCTLRVRARYSTINPFAATGRVEAR
jgi:hypothetical protein